VEEAEKKKRKFRGKEMSQIHLPKERVNAKEPNKTTTSRISEKRDRLFKRGRRGMTKKEEKNWDGRKEHSVNLIRKGKRDRRIGR